MRPPGKPPPKKRPLQMKFIARLPVSTKYLTRGVPVSVLPPPNAARSRNRASSPSLVLDKIASSRAPAHAAPEGGGAVRMLLQVFEFFEEVFFHQRRRFGLG